MATILDSVLKQRFTEIRRQTELLCEPLALEDYVAQSMPDASPVKWHLAHTAWFFETFLLKKWIPGYTEFHSGYAYLFNSYYYRIGGMHTRARRGLLTRPTVEETFRYRKVIEERVQDLLASASGHSPEVQALVELGLQHEQQHQELLLTDLKHLWAQNPLYPAYRRISRPAGHSSAKTAWIRMEGGCYQTGHRDSGFAFDNESPVHPEILRSYALASRPVTNSEFLAFMEDEGYQRPELWLSDGWQTVQQEKWNAPLYWKKEEDTWFSYTLSGYRKIQAEEPVCHVSYFEADAFARWAGARLPTEAEWEAAARPLPINGNFVESGMYHPVPDSDFKMFGNVWEWTQSPYTPYPGFRENPRALGEYNAKFMCNQYVLRGGSCASPASHIRATYRNFFAPDKRWQFSGIRLARGMA